jgi:hypothetical protein
MFGQYLTQARGRELPASGSPSFHKGVTINSPLAEFQDVTEFAARPHSSTWCG